MVRRRNTHIWQQDPHGHYVEPEWTAARLFQVESLGSKGDLIYDPCCGWGRIPRTAVAAGFTALASDIVDRTRDPVWGHNGFRFFLHDFLKDLPTCSPESVVSNPPFTGDFIEQFVTRALRIVRYKVAALVPLRRLPAAHWLECLPLETIWLLTPRPSLPPASYIVAGNEPGGGGQDFAWLVFNARRRSASRKPRMRWLHRSGDAS
jgi:hypothetical protein